MLSPGREVLKAAQLHTWSWEAGHAGPPCEPGLCLEDTQDGVLLLKVQLISFFLSHLGPVLEKFSQSSVTLVWVTETQTKQVSYI